MTHNKWEFQEKYVIKNNNSSLSNIPMEKRTLNKLFSGNPPPSKKREREIEINKYLFYNFAPVSSSLINMGATHQDYYTLSNYLINS